MRILIADDEGSIRLFLKRVLRKLDYEVLETSNGAEAWDTLQREKVKLVITDWLMPEMDGIELCQKIRNAKFPYYTYIIILTSKDAKDELIEGMEAGADDFMVKPFNVDELTVRVRAGERIIKLEEQLERQNETLSETNKKLNEAYTTIKNDLEAAAKVQTSLLPKSESIASKIEFDWLFMPSAILAGDIFNYFRLDNEHVGFYLLDVAGHGIPAAMLSFTLCKLLSPNDLKNNPLKKMIEKPPYYEIITPDKVMQDLNQRFQTDDDTMQYFTMIYCLVNLITGKTKMAQAGHPHPLLLKHGQQPEFIGQGGYPIGILPEAEFDEYHLQLNPGDRLMLYSDGITECTNKEMEPFSENRLIQTIGKANNSSLKEMIRKTELELRTWRGDDEFQDDVTLLAVQIPNTVS
jgi:sigma-B regulation protein RsbU (phosphoserine phosphatase)